MNLIIPDLSLVVLVGVSGAGKSTFARRHFKPTEILSSDYCRGLVSDDENSQAATRDAFDVLHFIARKRLAAGKLVVVDATNVQPDARKPLVQLARDLGRVLMVGHLLWYHPAVLKLKELIDRGEIGRVQYIYSTRLNLGRLRREENVLWSFAPHDVSVILGLLGEMPERVQAKLRALPWLAASTVDRLVADAARVAEGAAA
jgi:hypothetical protein